MKKKSFVGIITVLLALVSMIFVTFAEIAYPEWYYNKFGDYPEGTVNDWPNDPVYSQYLNEIGQRGYDNNVSGNGSSRSQKTKVYGDKYYPQITDVWWDGRTARWEKDGYVDYYEVSLYRDGDLVTTKNVKNGKSHSFANNMKRGGDHEYKFEVRAYNSSSNYWSPWEESDDIVVNGRNYDTSQTDSSITTIVPSPGVPASPLGRWVKQNNNWYYVFNSNGKAAANTWLLIAGKWYYFYSNGVMATGLINLNGKQYFLNNDGSMATGNVIINGAAHFFNSDGSMAY